MCMLTVCNMCEEYLPFTVNGYIHLMVLKLNMSTEGGKLILEDAKMCQSTRFLIIIMIIF